MQELISDQEFSKAIGLEKVHFKSVNKVLSNILKINKVNHLYQDSYSEDPINFIEKALEKLEIGIDYLESDLKNIPKTGPFIIVCNHPYGAIDGLILLYLIKKIRPDFKIMGNFLLHKIKPLEESLLSVNPFGEKIKQSSFKGTKAAIEHVKKGGCFGVFPAGEVSSFQKLKSICDPEWKPSIIKLIKNLNTPIVPVYFKGNNSMLFHILGLINPNLRTIKLPSEMFNKKQNQIKLRIGGPILSDEDFFDLNNDSFGKFIRAKTYALGSNLDVKKFFNPISYPLKKANTIDQEVNKIIIHNEINSLKENKLFEWGDYEIYCCKSADIPKVIQHIGVLREKTFRAVGEGTGKKSDIDEYDLYYHQLFIWDKKNMEIVGGYRVGFGKEIIKSYGKKGFYLNSLFKLKRKFHPYLEESLELGRSFVVPSYQKKAFPLFCLWKGIMYLLANNPDYRYLIGPVSISNKYAELSKSLIIDFIKTNYFDHDKAKMVKPRKQYKTKYKDKNYKMFIDYSDKDLFKLDKIIEEIEEHKIKIPVLFKKYLAQNAKIIGFNKDPKFNNALDGFMILDVSEVPLATVKSLSKDSNEINKYVNRFYTQYTNYLNNIPQY